MEVKMDFEGWLEKALKTITTLSSGVLLKQKIYSKVPSGIY